MLRSMIRDFQHDVSGASGQTAGDADRDARTHSGSPRPIEARSRHKARWPRASRWRGTACVTQGVIPPRAVGTRWPATQRFDPDPAPEPAPLPAPGSGSGSLRMSSFISRIASSVSGRGGESAAGRESSACGGSSLSGSGARIMCAMPRHADACWRSRSRRRRAPMRADRKLATSPRRSAASTVRSELAYASPCPQCCPQSSSLTLRPARRDERSWAAAGPPIAESAATTTIHPARARATWNTSLFIDP